MKNAYLIVAHEHPEQLLRLVDKLDSPKSNFYIHIDKKRPELFQTKEIQELRKRSNVCILLKMKIFWGGYSLVKTTILLLRKALENKENGYFHLLSGVDYPLKPITDIEQFFENNTNDYICYIPSESRCTHFVDRYYFYDSPCLDARTGVNNLRNKLMRFLLLFIQRLSWFLVQVLKIRIRPKIKMNFYHGSQWFSLTRESVEYILQTLTANPSIERRFHYTAVCDESFFTMLLMDNEERRKHIVNDDLRLRNSDGSLYRGGPCRTMADWEYIKTSPALFGRKFIPSLSNDIMQKIDELCESADNSN